MSRYLVIGSAPYIIEWWSEYGECFIQKGYKIIPINNAVKVIPKNYVFKWMRANDYLHFMKTYHEDVPLANDNDYDIVDTEPQDKYYNSESNVVTTFIDALHMILTDHKPIEVCVAGCDYNYDESKIKKLRN
jgi:predicted membrane-bound dolichyl-phosphate-mannose-protein mannosyltransferase